MKASVLKSWTVDLLAVFLASTLLYVAFGFLRPIFNPDEGRYSEIPREMIASGDYITPRLNGLPYFYKPPLFYWMQCASFKAFGYNRTSIRLASSMMAVLGICLVYVVGRFLNGRSAGLFASAILASTLFYYAIGQIVTLDMTVSVMMSIAMFALFGVFKTNCCRNLLILMFWVFCALAVMTKGIIGIMIPSAVGFLYLIFGGKKRFFAFYNSISKLNFVSCVIGIILFFAITLPWHILVCLANPALETSEGIFSLNPHGQGFFWYYFINEHFLRFVDSSTAMREQPFWFFIVLAPVGFIPWVFLLPKAIKNLISSDDSRLRDFLSFAIVWILFVVGFFSLSSSKLIPYITAVYPPMAVIVGLFFSQVWENLKTANLRVQKILMISLGLASSLAFIIAYYILAKRKTLEPEVLEICFWGALVISCVMAIISFFAIAFYRRKEEKKFWGIVFVGMFSLCASFNVNAAMAQGISAERLAEKIIELRKDEPIAIAFNYGRFHDLPVWLNETLLFVGEPPHEQRFGWKREMHLHKHRIFPDGKSLKDFLKRNKKLWVVIQSKSMGRLDDLKLPLLKKEIARNQNTFVYEISLKDEGK